MRIVAASTDLRIFSTASLPGRLLAQPEKEERVKRIRDRVAGLDVHKDSVVACAQVREGPEVAMHKHRFGTTTAEVAELAEWLADLGVTTVAMEATGVYWKPIVRHEALYDREEMKGLLLQAVAAAC